jgi:hypothetical protein
MDAVCKAAGTVNGADTVGVVLDPGMDVDADRAFRIGMSVDAETACDGGAGGDDGVEVGGGRTSSGRYLSMASIWNKESNASFASTHILSALSFLLSSSSTSLLGL